MKPIITIAALILLASCTTVQTKPVISITESDIEALNAEIKAAEQAVADLQAYKDLKAAEAAYTKAANAELMRLPVYKEWKKQQRSLATKVSKTTEYKRLQQLIAKREAWEAIINGGKK